MTSVQEKLLGMQDPKYKRFQSALIPSIDPTTMIGVRTPKLRELAKQLSREDMIEFITETPHDFFDENLLHVLILSNMKDFGMCVDAVNNFLPFVDNWAICDQLRPKSFKRNHSKLLPHVISWLTADSAYMVRFGIEMLMLHYLGEDFKSEYLQWVAAVQSKDYYVRMAVAWYFATALAEQSEAALPFIEQEKLAPWTHNKAIQKAVESRRIPMEQREYLKTLRIKEVNENE